MSPLQSNSFFVAFALLCADSAIVHDPAPIGTKTARRISDKAVALTTLNDSLQLLRERFNASKDRPRLIALLSPTCPVCLQGARSVSKHAVPAETDADADKRPSIIIVWMHMLPDDSEAEARIAAKIFRDQAVAQFHDPNALAARKFAEPLGQGIAEHVWDVYLYYEVGTQWQKDAPPKPHKWLHQMDNLGDGVAPKTGDAFNQALREMVGS